MQDTLSAIIVDDEPLARDLLRSFIEKEPDFRVLAECADGEAALAAIELHAPDVVFLDIEMPRLNGVGVVQHLNSVPKTPHVVFVTAYDRYAIDAFDLNAVDYLVKPLARERCKAALDRVRGLVRNDNIVSLTARLMAVVHGMEDQSRAQPPEQKIVVKKHDELQAIPLSSIIWLEAANQYVNIHSSDGLFVMSESLGRFAERLRDPRFVRIHRSAMINGHHVVRVSRNTNGTHAIQMSDGAELTLARARSAHLQKVLNLAGDVHTGRSLPHD